MSVAGIILAAGRGKRMHSRTPKVLHQLAGKPLVSYPTRLLQALKIKPIIVVVGYKAELVREAVEKLGSRTLFLYQRKALGTGDAVRRALPLTKNCKTVIVLNGDDSAFYRPQTLRQVLEAHLASNADMTFVTLEVEDPTGFGRVVRDAKGRFRGIVEEKAATDNQKKIKEINDGCYVFQTEWLIRYVGKIPKSRAGEYYLTSLVEIGIQSDAKIETLKLPDSSEWFGIDTMERLREAEEKMRLLGLTLHTK